MKGFRFPCLLCKGGGCVTCQQLGGYKNGEEMVLARLRIGTLTDHEARDQLGITRLAAVVHRLRKRHDIATEDVDVPNRYGRLCRIAQYKLIRENAWSSSESTRDSAALSAH